MASNSRQSDRLSFFYRDEIFTTKFLGGDFIIRNDFDKQQLWPPDKVIDDNEVINRGPLPLPTLGDCGRLSRLIGLFIDRLADNREQMMTWMDEREIDLETIPLLADYLGYVGLDIENWNVERQKRLLRIMNWILKRAGRANSYEAYGRLLGFEVRGNHLTARRRMDSVVYNARFDPYVQPIPMDTMGSMDTWHESFPLALLRWRVYKLARESTSGVTSAVGARLLTDAAGSFIANAQIGNLIVMRRQATYDPGVVGDSFYHLVTEVHSDTELKVDSDWYVGSASDVSYLNHWEVPMPDEMVDNLLEHFREISPASMRTMHIEEPV